MRGTGGGTGGGKTGRGDKWGGQVRGQLGETSGGGGQVGGQMSMYMTLSTYHINSRLHNALKLNESHYVQSSPPLPPPTHPPESMSAFIPAAVEATCVTIHP